jgi:hypothetical protein
MPLVARIHLCRELNGGVQILTIARKKGCTQKALMNKDPMKAITEEVAKITPRQSQNSKQDLGQVER